MVKSVIFDMNGVIINDERVHQETWRLYCKKYNFHLTEDEFKHKVFGRTDKDTIEYLHKRKVTPEELEIYANAKTDFAISIFTPQLKLVDGLGVFLEELYQNDIPMGIATSSRKRYYNFIMDGLKIRKYFKVTVTAQDITKGKPDPEIYLKAADQLGVHPSDCIVFEDTISGIKSAKSAGMKVIGVATTHEKDELNLSDKVINDFTEINVEQLKKL